MAKFKPTSAASLFGIGTKVKFLNTAQSGIVTDKIGDGMVMVLLDGDNMEIPAFEEDLIRAETMPQNVMGQFDLPMLKPVAAAIDPFFDAPKPAPTAFIVPNNLGILLLFEPKYTAVRSGEVKEYAIFLVNASPYAVVLELDWVIADGVVFSKDTKIEARAIESIGTMPNDELNELPQVDYTLRAVTTEGLGAEYAKTLKIKAQQFFKAQKYLPFWEAPTVHQYVLLTLEEVKNTDGAKKSNNEQLAQYTKNLLRERRHAQAQADLHRAFDHVPSVQEFASFVNEIDLHIEIIANDHARMTNTEIIQTQLRAYEAFMSKSIRLHVPKVYIIHGIGKGRLKELIHARLRRNNEVVSFKNEYFQKYGWGATEVWL